MQLLLLWHKGGSEKSRFRPNTAWRSLQILVCTMVVQFIGSFMENVWEERLLFSFCDVHALLTELIFLWFSGSTNSPRQKGKTPLCTWEDACWAVNTFQSVILPPHKRPHFPFFAYGQRNVPRLYFYNWDFQCRIKAHLVTESWLNSFVLFHLHSAVDCCQFQSEWFFSIFCFFVCKAAWILTSGKSASLITFSKEKAAAWMKFAFSSKKTNNEKERQN